MDRATCRVIYCDSRIGGDATVRRTDVSPDRLSSGGHSTASMAPEAPEEVMNNIGIMLKVFEEVHLCQNGSAFSKRLRQFEEDRQQETPVVVFLDVDPKTNHKKVINQERLDREIAEVSAGTEPLEHHGLELLKHLSMGVHGNGLNCSVVPVAVVRCEGFQPSSSTLRNSRLRTNRRTSESTLLLEPLLVLRCLNAGAVDVVVSPLGLSQLQQIVTVTYKARLQYAKDKQSYDETKRIRKRSWVGVEEERSYAYLRESMVSSLMDSICHPEMTSSTLSTDFIGFDISPERKSMLVRVVGSWQFSAHEFTDDELMYAAYLMFSHCLQMPELGKWWISDQELRNFLAAARAAYNSFVLYHNFRHVVDVLQALFFFLLRIGALPSYPLSLGSPEVASPSPVAKLLGPLDTLVLLVSAIGHDVGHPGVNNAFLVTLKAPLAQLYNDKSVLEAFHCAAYSQILRRYWKSTYEDAEFRRLLINTILATDMGIHPEYMANLGNLQDKLHHCRNTENWTVKLTHSNKDLILGLLIKCADISNVARPFDTAAQWAQILQLEFARQGEMERDIGMNSTLFGGPPELGNLQKLANSQIGFMNFFGLPLFEGVADIMPGLQYAVIEIARNKVIWEAKIENDRKHGLVKTESHAERLEGTHSPRSVSPDKDITGYLPDEASRKDTCMNLADSQTSVLLDDSRLNAFKDASTVLAAVRDGIPTTSDPIRTVAQSNAFSQVHKNIAISTSRRSSHGSPDGKGSSNIVHSYSNVCHTQDPSDVTGQFSTPNTTAEHSEMGQPSLPAGIRANVLSHDDNVDLLTTPTDLLDRSSTVHSEVENSSAAKNSISFTRHTSITSTSEPAEGSAQGHPGPHASDIIGNNLHKDQSTKDPDSFHQVRRKSSKWKFDFWRRKRQNEKEGQISESSSVSPRPRMS